MINLIPPQAKKIVAREYWKRVIAVWFLILSSALIVMAFLSVPTYILIRQFERAMASQIDYAKAEQGSYTVSERAIKNANALINHLNRDGEQMSFSLLVEKLDTIAGESITLTEFDFTEEAGILNQISLIGHADTRLSLSNFRDALLSDALFVAVDLPISNLAKDKDITFSIKVTLEDKAADI